jgi:elongation factor Ts
MARPLDGRGQLRNRFRIAQRRLHHVARRLAQLVAEKNPADASALNGFALDGRTVDSTREALVQKIGENISIRRFARSPRRQDCFSTCMAGPHRRHRRRLTAAAIRPARIAMHIAASAAPGAVRPVSVSRDQVPAELIERSAIFRRSG